MQPNGKMFIDDVGPGDVWYFPAGYPHSIQGLEGDGCEFLLVFDDGAFSEDDTFLLSEFLVHTPPDTVQKNMGWGRQAFVNKNQLDSVGRTDLQSIPSGTPNLFNNLLTAGSATAPSVCLYTHHYEDSEIQHAIVGYDTGGYLPIWSSL